MEGLGKLTYKLPSTNILNQVTLEYPYIHSIMEDDTHMLLLFFFFSFLFPLRDENTKFNIIIFQHLEFNIAVMFSCIIYSFLYGINNGKREYIFFLRFFYIHSSSIPLHKYYEKYISSYSRSLKRNYRKTSR